MASETYVAKGQRVLENRDLANILGGVSSRTLEYANRSRRRTAIGRIQQGIEQRAYELSSRQMQYNTEARVANRANGGTESTLRPFRVARNMTLRAQGFNQLYENGRRLNSRNRR